MEHILIVDDEESMLEFLEYMLTKQGYRVTLASEAKTALKKLSEDSFDLVISDLRMPDMDGLQMLQASRQIDADVPFIFITAYASSDTAIEALKLGAYDYVTKPFQVEELKNLVGNALQASSLKRKVRLLESEQRKTDQLVGVSPPMLEIYKLIGTIAATDSTVLITGESGTGKELVARAVHRASPRRDEPFVSVNCGAFTESLLESELFGYVKGSFTGAVANKKGLFETAAGGTLFLDEVGEMSPAMQVKLLRSLQEKRIRRVGGTEEIPVDCRLIAATNRNLEQRIEEGEFREDLYYRLAVIPIRIPPLRDRASDIVALVQHFIRLHNEKQNREIAGITEEGLARLESYPWPGNVRELENVIERAIALEPGEYIQRERLPEKVRNSEQPTAEAPGLPFISVESGFDLEPYLDSVEARLLSHALELTKGNQKKAAELLKLTYRSFRHRLERLNVRKKVRHE